MNSSYKNVEVHNPEAWTDYICREMNYFLPDYCRGGVVVDCGCNVGAFELTHLNRFDMYYCYDISQVNLNVLKNNLKDKNIKYKAEKRACWNESNQMIDVYAHSNEHNQTDYFGNSGNFSVKKGLNPDGVWGWKEENTVDSVKTISLDEITETLAPIKILKIDTEGAEYDFIPGKDLSQIEFIVGEFHNHGSQQWRDIIKFICQTHNVIRTDGLHVFTFERKK